MEDGRRALCHCQPFRLFWRHHYPTTPLELLQTLPFAMNGLPMISFFLNEGKQYTWYTKDDNIVLKRMRGLQWIMDPNDIA